MRLVCFLLLLLPVFGMCFCPYLDGDSDGSDLPVGHPVVTPRVQAPKDYRAALDAIDFDSVKADLKTLLTDSQDFWPADYGNYGPFFIRLAWHNAGSYRIADGNGGADGGRQRFDPERSWDDNTNLDKARRLLWPIKEKYGLGLSWGDLFILAGNTAIKEMGGPILGFCAGRVDDVNGDWSVPLGPSAEQEAYGPCEVNGECSSPLGATTVGLIYVNPEGPMANPDPDASAGEIRDTFGRMAMNDRETVALIGGGHAFGKTHGPCPDGPGHSPKEDPFHPWEGNCGTGKGADAFTSGFEGPWTQSPTQWDNGYYQLLINNNWTKETGPGGHWQWKSNSSDIQAPAAHGTGTQSVMMLTSDVALTRDASYRAIVEEFAADQSALDTAFSHAWYKLTTRDMGPYERCVGNDVPSAQSWQYPLPDPPATLADFDAVKADIKAALTVSQTSLPADVYSGAAHYGPLFVRLAWACSASFRFSDYTGGCNGARLRHSPEKDWPANVDLDKTLALLQEIKTTYDESLSWADLITLAGYTAIEEMGGNSMEFCGGRTDASDGEGSQYLEAIPDGSFNTTAFELSRRQNLMGLSARDFVALVGGGHSLGQMHSDRSGFTGQWDASPTTLDNAYFKNLIALDWEEYTVSSTGKKQYKATDQELYMLKTDLLLKTNAEYLEIAHEYASDNDKFLSAFASAWVRAANADRFDGPTGNVCATTVDPCDGCHISAQGQIVPRFSLLILVVMCGLWTNWMGH